MAETPRFEPVLPRSEPVSEQMHERAMGVAQEPERTSEVVQESERPSEVAQESERPSEVASEPERRAQVPVLELASPSAAPVRAGATPESVLASLRPGWPSDLVQVETNAGRVQPIQEFEELLGLRAGRTRPVLAPISDEPLIQVETRRRETPPDDTRRETESTPV